MFNANIFISQLIHIKIISNLKERMEKKPKKGEKIGDGESKRE